jgi:hypothetical protein
VQATGRLPAAVGLLISVDKEARGGRAAAGRGCGELYRRHTGAGRGLLRPAPRQRASCTDGRARSPSLAGWPAEPRSAGPAPGHMWDKAGRPGASPQGAPGLTLTSLTHSIYRSLLRGPN